MKSSKPYEELKAGLVSKLWAVKIIYNQRTAYRACLLETIFDSVNFGWEDDNQNLRSILEGNLF